MAPKKEPAEDDCPCDQCANTGRIEVIKWVVGGSMALALMFGGWIGSAAYSQQDQIAAQETRLQMLERMMESQVSGQNRIIDKLDDVGREVSSMKRDIDVHIAATTGRRSDK
jgi:hypothetical protein